MAKIVLTDASITINSVALSDLSNSVTINYEVDSVEVTAFGDTGHKFTGGLQNLSVEVALMQDYAATKTEATIYPLVGTTTTLLIKPTSGAVSATNPSYTITGAYLALADAISWAKNQGHIGKDAKVLTDSVAAVSVGILDGAAMLDLCYEEDVRAETDMNVVCTGTGKFIEVQGTAEGEPFERSLLNDLLDLAVIGCGEITELQRRALA